MSSTAMPMPNGSAPARVKGQKFLQLTPDIYTYMRANSSEYPDILKEIQTDNLDVEYGGMAVPPEQGRLMSMLVQISGAKNVLEIGVFTGYSSCALALGLPEDGRLTALEVSEQYASKARGYWQKAGLEGKIDLKLGLASESLEQLLQEGRTGTYDFAFIDADKRNQVLYYNACVDLVRQGGLIILDNVLRGGKVLSTEVDNVALAGVRACNLFAAQDPRTETLMLCISDGITICRKL